VAGDLSTATMGIGFHRLASLGLLYGIFLLSTYVGKKRFLTKCMDQKVTLLPDEYLVAVEPLVGAFTFTAQVDALHLVVP